MSDVRETLQQLVTRRLHEMGRRHGRTTPLSLREAYQALPEPKDEDRPWVTYELVRRVSKGQHRNIGDRAADTLATMLGVSVSTIHAAARQRPRLEMFELPERASRLDADERRVVLLVIDAILKAGERSLRADEDSPLRPTETKETQVVAPKPPAEPAQPPRTAGPGSSQR